MAHIGAPVARTGENPATVPVVAERKAIVIADLQEIIGKLGRTEMRMVLDLTFGGKGLRKLSKKKVVKLGGSIRLYGVLMPILITPAGEIIAGEARVEAAKELGLGQVPCLVAGHLTPVQVRAYRIADNKLAEGEWDWHALALELEAIIELGEISIDGFGFETGEIDVLLQELGELPVDAPDPADDIPERQPAVSVRGNLWHLGEHRLICGSVRDEDVIKSLMASCIAAM